MFRRFMVSFVCVFLVGCLLVLPAWADAVLVDVSSSQRTGWQSLTTGSISSWGHSFVGNDEYLSSATMYVRNTSAIAGHWRGLLLNSSSLTVEYDVAPLQASLVDVDFVSYGDGGWVTVVFDGTYLLDSTKYYAVVLMLNGTCTGDLDGGYYVSGDYGRYNVAQDLNAWSVTGNCAIMKVYTTDTYGGVYGGEDDDASGGSIDSTITSLGNWFINLAVLLIPAAFLGIFCKLGKWGFIMGLAIGAGLGYAFLSTFPLWLLVLIAVGELGLAYQTVSTGG